MSPDMADGSQQHRPIEWTPQSHVPIIQRRSSIRPAIASIHSRLIHPPKIIRRRRSRPHSTPTPRSFCARTRVRCTTARRRRRRRPPRATAAARRARTAETRRHVFAHMAMWGDEVGFTQRQTRWHEPKAMKGKGCANKTERQENTIRVRDVCSRLRIADTQRQGMWPMTRFRACCTSDCTTEIVSWCCCCTCCCC